MIRTVLDAVAQPSRDFYRRDPKVRGGFAFGFIGVARAGR
jgi:hypothetical protein